MFFFRVGEESYKGLVSLTSPLSPTRGEFDVAQTDPRSNGSVTNVKDSLARGYRN